MPMATTTEKMGSNKSKNRPLYKHLGLGQSATTAEIKKAYYKCALECHPDRVKGSNEEVAAAKERFQLIGKAYEILSDDARRKLYDESGIVDDGAGGQHADWSEYFRELYKRVTLSDLDAFKAEYVGSREEYEDILAAYVKFKGVMSSISEAVFFGDVESDGRYLATIKSAIAKGIVPEFKEYSKIVSDEAAFRAQQRRRSNWAAKEAVEAAEMAKELGLHGTGHDSLVSAIQGRRKGRFDSLISSLEAKYSEPRKKKTPTAVGAIEKKQPVTKKTKPKK